MTTNETLIKVEGLKKSFDKVDVLKGINIEIKRGEVVVIIGPSGCGKSTFLRTLNLLELLFMMKLVNLYIMTYTIYLMAN